MPTPRDIVPLTDRDYAQAMFDVLLGSLAVPHSARMELAALWREPHRRYHVPGHAGILWHRHLAHGGDPADAVAAHAIAYHDAVFQVGAIDNETRSCAVWRRHGACLPIALREKVAHAILATACHASDPCDEDAQWMVDLDLTPLGEPWPLFAATSDALRAEAHAMPPAAPTPGREHFLDRLLGLPVLFRSDRAGGALRRVYEDTARENLKRVRAG